MVARTPCGRRALDIHITCGTDAAAGYLALVSPPHFVSHHTVHMMTTIYHGGLYIAALRHTLHTCTCHIHILYPPHQVDHATIRREAETTTTTTTTRRTLEAATVHPATETPVAVDPAYTTTDDRPTPHNRHYTHTQPPHDQHFTLPLNQRTRRPTRRPQMSPCSGKHEQFTTPEPTPEDEREEMVLGTT